MSLPLGAVLGERFELQREIGAGGMGIVYQGWDRETARPMAIKVLRGGGLRGAERFLREAAILAEIDHPAVVGYVGQHRSVDGDSYLVMEWLEGQTLADRLRAGPLTVVDSIALARRIAEGLAAVSRRGIVHRDLKPSNVFLPGGMVSQAKILDFGIATYAEHDVQLTETGAVLGTPLYMAPEQARGGREIDQRADIYSLGAVLFECVAGRPPFMGASAMAILCKICLEEAPSLQSVVPTAPAALDALLRRMLAKDAVDRPADAEALVDILDHLQTFAAAKTPSSPPAPRALSEAEQRVVCLTLVGGRALSSTADGGLPAAPVPIDDVRAALAEHGARLEELIDGSMVISFNGLASARDQSAAMARCAISLRRWFPESPIVVCTGRATLSGRVPLGEVVDRAVMLLQTSRAGSVRLDTLTAGLLDARFEVDETDGDAYLTAERNLGRETRTVLGKSVPCVGREAELTMLQGIFNSVVEDCEARAVVLTAPAGGGKTRLREEFIERLGRGNERFELLLGRADALRSGSTFGLLAALLRSAAGISGDDSVEDRHQKLRARVSRRLIGEDAARIEEFLGELTGILADAEPSAALRAARQDARLMGDQMRGAWLDWLTAECSTGPVVLILEDLHWSDAPSVQVLGLSLLTLRERPLMVLAMARPEVSMKFPRVWEDAGAQMFPLVPLSPKSCTKLAGAILGDSVAPELLNRAVQAAEGNPFFLEELLRGAAAGQTELPDTVVGLLQSRLDALGADSNRFLRAASIFGETFQVQAATSLLGSAHGIDVEQVLHSLREHEVVQPSREGSGREYAFRHALVRDASYAMLTEEDRVLGHGLAGDWLERAGETDAMVLAEHFDAGRDLGRAAVWYTKAGAQALQAEDLRGAIARAERAIACGARGEVLSEISVIEAQAHYWLGAPALAATAALRGVAHVPVGSVPWFQSISEIVGAYVEHGGEELIHPAEAVRWATAARDAIPLTPEAVEAQVACLSWAAGALRTYELPLATSLLQRAALAFAALASPSPWASHRFHNATALLHGARGNLMAAIGQFQLALDAADEAGDTRNACALRVDLGATWTDLGQLERASPLLKRALADAQHRSLRYVESFALPGLVMLLSRQGRLDEAQAALDLALDVATIGCSNWSAALIHLAGSMLAAAKHSWVECDQHARVAMESCGPTVLPAALSFLAASLFERGREEEALEASQKATRLLEELGSTEFFESFVRLMAAETRMAVGDESGAREAIREAHKLLMARAEQIPVPEFRTSFLSQIRENARTLELAKAWGEA